MSDPNDIVTRLRRDCMSLIADEAADEIKRLREQLTASHQSHGNAIVRHPADANELRQVMEERDEARRDACMSWAWMYRPSENAETEARKEAKRRGWDCFKGATYER